MKQTNKIKIIILIGIVTVLICILSFCTGRGKKQDENPASNPTSKENISVETEVTEDRNEEETFDSMFHTDADGESDGDEQTNVDEESDGDEQTNVGEKTAAKTESDTSKNPGEDTKEDNHFIVSEDTETKYGKVY